MSKPKETKESDKSCSLCKQFRLKPLTNSNIAFYYAPAFGAMNYAALSVNVMNPGLLMRLFPSRDVTNILLVNSMLGSALYIYNRPHLLGAAKHMKFVYSGYGALMFNFGSVLVWAVLRSVAPRSNCIATIVGLLTACALGTVGYNCLDYVDSQLNTSPPK